jgi:hypothetical protein
MLMKYVTPLYRQVNTQNNKPSKYVPLNDSFFRSEPFKKRSTKRVQRLYLYCNPLLSCLNMVFIMQCDVTVPLSESNHCSVVNMVDEHTFGEKVDMHTGIKGHLCSQQQNKNAKNNPHTRNEMQKPG